MSTLGPGLSVSIVVYRSAPAVLVATLSSLAAAVKELNQSDPQRGGVSLCVIDNDHAHEAQSVLERPDLEKVLAQFDPVRLLEGHGNIGYGRGHNLALENLTSAYHLVLNPDVVLAPDSLARALRFLDEHREFGLLAPRILDPAGHQQFLCRRYPSLLDLLVRGFFPAPWRAHFAKRLAHYEMRDLIGPSQVVRDPPIVSGCFMLFRTDVLRRLGGFDPGYFLYFEDYDLSLRAARLAGLVYVPSVVIEHGAGGAARKGVRHIALFLRSAIRFFSTHGWKLV
jgi:GT2 family glycosyltransferase